MHEPGARAAEVQQQVGVGVLAVRRDPVAVAQAQRRAARAATRPTARVELGVGPAAVGERQREPVRGAGGAALSTRPTVLANAGAGASLDIRRVLRQVAQALDRAAAVPGRHLTVDQRHLRARDGGRDLGQMSFLEVVRLAGQQHVVDVAGVALERDLGIPVIG